MDALTRRQRDVLAYLRACATEGHAPTLDEICGALGVRSRGSVHKHVQALVDAGLVEPPAGRRRGLHLRREAEGDTLPLLGRIAAGRPLEAVTDSETVPVPPHLRGRGRCYVLEVRGDSMADDGILDGDQVVVEHRDQAPNGAVVVVLIDHSEVTLKRIEQRPEGVVLHPANAAYSPMTYSADRVVIQGVVTGQMRRY